MARYNRHINPAFDVSTGGWTQSGTKAVMNRVGGGTYARPGGGLGWIVDARNNGSNRPAMWTSGTFGGLTPVTVGQTYTVSAYVYHGAAASRTVRLDADMCSDAAGTWVRTQRAEVVVARETWTRISATVTAAPGETHLSTYFQWFIGVTPADNTYVAITQAMIEDGPTLGPYRDGNSAGWAWSGTSGLSMSRNLDPVADAGSDITRTAGNTVSLSGSGSADPEGATISYAWTVLDAGGTGLTNSGITNRLTAFPYFTAPDVTSDTPVTLRLTVTDPEGNQGTDDVTVTIEPDALVVEVTGSGGLALGGTATYQFTEGNDVIGNGGLTIGGGADVLRTLSALVSGAGGARVGGTDTPLFITPSFVTATGGAELGGGAVYRYRAASVPAGVTIEWDLDGDGKFTRPEETITDYVMSVESLTGRDYPSQLTGRAGPGKLRVELLNQDNRFSHFNQNSPLNQGGMGLQVGSRIRLRTIESTNPDATQIAADSFNRDPAASLGTADSGHVWTSMNLGIANHRAAPQIASMGTVNVGSTTHYVQATFGNPGIGAHDGSGNSFGVIYRYTNDANYARMQYNVASERLEVIDRIGGVNTTRDFGYVEPYDGMVLGAYVTGTSVRWYLDGVLYGTTTTGLASGTRCGIYAVALPAHAVPWVDDFTVWDKPAETSVGILWTGHVTDIAESVELGPRRRVKIDAEGPLAQAASAEVYPTSSAYGRPTGTVVGNTLARAGLLDPPGPIEMGDITTGAFGFEKASALEVARDFEEAELGFLYETQEGRLGFDSRSARDDRTSQAVFADFAGAQLGYHRLEPRDWRREIVNRVEAGIAGTAPQGNQNYVWTNWAEVPAGLPVPSNHYGVFWMRPSDAPVPITEGQLLIVMVSAHRMPGWDGSDYVSGTVWLKPPGWEVIDGGPTYSSTSTPGAGDDVPPFRVYAKIADFADTNPVAFGYIRGDLDYTPLGYGETYSAIQRPPYIVSMYNVENFFGDIREGVRVSEIDYWASGSTNPFPSPTAFPDWGPEHPSLFITALSGHRYDGQQTAVLTDLAPPDGYRSQADSPMFRQRNAGAAANTAAVFVAWSDAYGSRAVESPSRWKGYIATPGYGISTVTIAVRGKNGDPPVKNGHVVETRDDVASQRKYNIIRTHREESNLFMGIPDAWAYGDEVLARHANERPIMALSFWANTTIAHRTQAITRRVGDRITVESDNATGLNYSGDYFIESINHVISSGGKRWEVTYELSPAT